MLIAMLHFGAGEIEYFMGRDQLVYIAGSGHSGSTLLDMLLGGHDQISSLGEVHRLTINARRSGQLYSCNCGKAINECPFWCKVADELQVMLHVDQPDILERHLVTEPRNLELDQDVEAWEPGDPKKYRYRVDLTAATMVVGQRSIWVLMSLLSKDVRTYRNVIKNSLILYEAVRRAHHTPIVVDSTKNARRLQGLYLESHGRLRILNLLRDGRALCYSRMKRRNMPMAECARIWKMEQTKQQMIQRSIPDDLITSVRYEDLSEHTEQELSRICHVLGIEYQLSMLDFRNERHNIGGNHWMRFRHHETQVRRDDRWRSELAAEDLATFERIAGPLNRKLGYSS